MYREGRVKDTGPPRKIKKPAVLKKERDTPPQNLPPDRVDEILETRTWPKIKTITSVAPRDCFFREAPTFEVTTSFCHSCAPQRRQNNASVSSGCKTQLAVDHGTASRP
jgi:hypothetical protein